MAIKINCRLNHQIHVGGLSHVYWDRNRFAAFGLNFTHQGLKSVKTARSKNNLASFFCKQARRVSPNPDEAPVMMTTLPLRGFDIQTNQPRRLLPCSSGSSSFVRLLRPRRFDDCIGCDGKLYHLIHMRNRNDLHLRSRSFGNLI